MTAPAPPPRHGINVAAIPAEMRELPHWIGWVYVWVPAMEGKPGRFTKQPRIARGDGQRRASTTGRETWASLDTALAFWRQHQWVSGIGFVLTDTPYVGIDLDHKVDDQGNIDPLALRVIRLFDSYTERTPSRRGFHIIVRGELSGHGQNDQSRGLEVYAEGRYFTVTGDALSDAALAAGKVAP